MTRAIVASFHKDSGGRLKLWSLTAIEEKAGHNGQPYLSRTEYDVEWSRRYGYIFDQTGGGGCNAVSIEGIYFVSGKVQVEEKPCALVDHRDRPPWRSKRTKAIRARNRTRRLSSLPRAFALEPGWDLLDWLEHEAINENAVFCATCRDWLPEGSFCSHVWWCEKVGWWSSPSDRQGCKCKTWDERADCDR